VGCSQIAKPRSHFCEPHAGTPDHLKKQPPPRAAPMAPTAGSTAGSARRCEAKGCSRMSASGGLRCAEHDRSKLVENALTLLADLAAHKNGGDSDYHVKPPIKRAPIKRAPVKRKSKKVEPWEEESD
jgi:hypothetical protein